VNLRHAAALALVGWYLMVPPVQSDGTFRFKREGRRVEYVGTWSVVSKFQTYGECREAQRDLQERGYRTSLNLPRDKESMRDVNAECVATDDPRLKEK